MPVSTEVVHASSEYVVSRAKNVLFVALGLVTLPNTTVWLPVGAAELPVFFILSFPAVAVLTLHPEASPRFVGCEDRVDEALLKPLGVEQAPLAVVHITASNDWRTVPDGTVKVKVYVVLAEATELPSVSVRPVICAAPTCWLAPIIIRAKSKLTASPKLLKRSITNLIRVFI